MENQTTTKPLSIEEAAQFTGLSKAYLYKLVHMGKIPHYKPLNGRVFFKQSELESFIFQGRRSADYELREKAQRHLTRKGA